MERAERTVRVEMNENNEISEPTASVAPESRTEGKAEGGRMKL